MNGTTFYISFSEEIPVATLQGKTLISISTINNEEILFSTSDNEQYVMFHRQGCCEGVWLQDVVGDFNDLIGSPLLLVEESSNSDDAPVTEYTPESYTWTYYKFATIKGYVDLRWFGQSNGWYSESVNFVKLDDPVYALNYPIATHYHGHSSVPTIIPPQSAINLLH
jgi:hypothetical protein